MQVIGELLAPKWLHARPEDRRSLLSARDLQRQVHDCAAHFGAHAGQKLAELLCELGFCFRCATSAHTTGAPTRSSAGEGAGEDLASQFSGSDDDTYFFPTLLEQAPRPDGLQAVTYQ